MVVDEYRPEADAVMEALSHRGKARVDGANALVADHPVRIRGGVGEHGEDGLGQRADLDRVDGHRCATSQRDGR